MPASACTRSMSGLNFTFRSVQCRLSTYDRRVFAVTGPLRGRRTCFGLGHEGLWCVENRKITTTQQRFDGSQRNLVWVRIFTPSNVLIVKILNMRKSKMADGRHFEKVEKSPYLGNGLTDCHKIWHEDTCSLS